MAFHGLMQAMNTGFYSSSIELTRSDAVLGAYKDFLLARNGEGFVAREKRMAGEFDATRAPSVLQLDADRFNRNYASLRERAVSEEELALLAFVKINAGEAYGVECVSKARERQQNEAPGVTSEVERLITREEQFHTRLLVGAAGHFHGADGKRLEVTGAWKPGLPLRVIIGSLVYAPRALFHPVLLGAEISGVFAFNWLLTRLRDLFPDAPSVRESMERRLVDVLIDEVGHIAFNRVLVGAAGRAVARTVAKQISWSHQLGSPELVSLGFSPSVLGRLDSFDLGDLPDEVRRRAFFA